MSQQRGSNIDLPPGLFDRHDAAEYEITNFGGVPGSERGDGEEFVGGCYWAGEGRGYEGVGCRVGC